ncbi:MAG: hypothetical protein IJS97_02830 [Prevotella sp.]|nr:hypothetical protein [Prevotella sp.]
MTKASLILALLLTVSACSTIECPLNNRVYTNYILMGDVTTIADTLTVSTTRADDTDSVFLNRVTAISKFILPISYQSEADVFYFELHDSLGNQSIDTVAIHKEDRPRFEAVDCNPTFFHTLKRVETTHHAIDSIVINHPTVNYDTSKEHLHIYFKSNIY